MGQRKELEKVSTGIERGRLEGSLRNGVLLWLEAFLCHIVQLKVHLQLYAGQDVGQRPWLLRLLSHALRPPRPEQNMRLLERMLIRQEAVCYAGRVTE